MNKAIALLKQKAEELWGQITLEEGIQLVIDPVEEPKQETQGKPVEATFSVTKMRDEDMSKSMTECNNLHTDLCLQQLNLFDILGRPEKVWIYNVSGQEYELKNALVRRLHVPACKEDKEYAVVISIPLVVIQPKPDVETNETSYFFMDGRRIAMDLINPSNLGLDQDQKTIWTSYAIGNDFSKRGVFFSVHNPPLKKEVKAARKRLMDYYRDVIERANIVRITAAAASLGLPTSEVTAAVNFVEGPRTTR